MGKFDDPMVVDPANGVVRGDSKAMPNRGTSTGMVGKGEPYGASVDQNATNRMGGFSADSDPMMKEWADDERQTIGPRHDPEYGKRMGGTGSDPMMDTTPGDEGMPGDRD